MKAEPEPNWERSRAENPEARGCCARDFRWFGCSLAFLVCGFGFLVCSVGFLGFKFRRICGVRLAILWISDLGFYDFGVFGLRVPVSRVPCRSWGQ